MTKRKTSFTVHRICTFLFYTYARIWMACYVSLRKMNHDFNTMDFVVVEMTSNFRFISVFIHFLGTQIDIFAFDFPLLHHRFRFHFCFNSIVYIIHFLTDKQMQKNINIFVKGSCTTTE